jgi:hypothetical protein
MTTCSICGQQVAVDELQEHMRIELLDPKWKEQRDNLEARKAQASELQGGANVVTSLQNLARKRVDIFGTETDEERRKREETLEREKRKERGKGCLGWAHIQQSKHSRQIFLPMSTLTSKSRLFIGGKVWDHKKPTPLDLVLDLQQLLHL